MSDKILENFMKEFFPFKNFKEIGLFTNEMKGDFQAQADRVCLFFGYKSVFEYGAKECRVHISYGEEHTTMSVNEKGDLEQEPFVTVIKSVYD